VPSGTLDAIYFVTLGEHGYRCDCPHGEHVRWFDEARCEHVKAVRQFIAFERARVRVVCTVGPELLEELRTVERKCAENALRSV
jgi:hypothetical protein